MIIGYARRASSVVVRRQQLLQKTSPDNYWLDFDLNLAVTILVLPSMKIVQMVLVRCISRSHKLKIDFRDETFKTYSCLKPQGLEP